jgi:hypothetical protein
LYVAAFASRTRPCVPFNSWQMADFGLLFDSLIQLALIPFWRAYGIFQFGAASLLIFSHTLLPYPVSLRSRFVTFSIVHCIFCIDSMIEDDTQSTLAVAPRIGNDYFLDVR